MNAAANDLEAGFKSVVALSCRWVQLMAHRVRGGGGGRVFADISVKSLQRWSSAARGG